MKKIWIRLLVLLGVIVLAAAAFTYYRSTREQEEEERVFTAMEAASLPVIYGELSGQRVNILHGYTSERDLSTTETPLIPMENSILSLKVALYGNTMESFTYEIVDRDSGEKISEGAFSDWSNDSDTLNCSLSLGSLVSGTTDYLLNLTVELGNGRTVYYYARVCDAEETQAKAMLNYVVDFHDDLYVWDDAKTHESNLESKSGYDQGTLQDVSIYSTISQLAWGNMSVTEVPASLSLTILELDGSFGSFLLEYEVESGDPAETYLVKEYFSVHSSNNNLYLMDYRRRTTERISGEDSRYSQGYIDFGIVDPDEVELMSTEEEDVIVFSAAEEIYRYEPATGNMMNVFTFLDEDDQVRTGYRRYATKLLRVSEAGDVEFLVYGYMNRGAHEGQVGVSSMTYQAENRSLLENFFLPYEGSVEELTESVEQLTYLNEDGICYVLVGDWLYAVDTANASAEVILTEARKKELAVNGDHTAIIWKNSTEDQYSQNIQIMYLDTGATQSVKAPNGDWVAPVGFIEDDCILLYGHSGERTEVDGEAVDPAYALVILNRSGREEVRYSYDSIYISSVEVKDGQIIMGRLSQNSDGSYRHIEDDMLMQSSGSSTDEGLSLRSYNEDLRMRVYRLTNVGDSRNPNSISIQVPRGINYETSEALAVNSIPAIDGTGQYYAYAEGDFYGTYSTAGSAINSVFDGMGIVMDADGRIVWRRSGRAGQVSLTPVDLLTGNGSDGRNACLTMMAQMSGQSGFLFQAEEGSSALESVDALFPGRALNLTGASVRALMYYLNKEVPLLLIDKDDNSFLILGYDLYNMEVYDPSTGEIVRQGQQDMENLLSDDSSCIGFIPN